ncbi:cbb3-type cytochrome c oxidase subunit 3 [Hyphomonas sp.]|uniref:cbb3-type cytochrome c oxidase subunit 3 n=1 Tax=Hyphomonas sp. TaxID=87 RepID=UPI00391B3855
MYSTLSSFAQTWGLGFFVLMFAVALTYALWPANRDKFRDAASTPLIDKDPSDD